MVFIEKNMRAPDDKHCLLCMEPMPTETWLCPNCVIVEHPLDVLEDLQRLVEACELITDDKHFAVTEGTFWTLHAVARASFGREERVMEAVDMLEDMMYDIQDHRAKVAMQERRAKRMKYAKIAAVTIIVAIALAIALICIQQ